jgi:hypothetical protein
MKKRLFYIFIMMLTLFGLTIFGCSEKVRTTESQQTPIAGQTIEKDAVPTQVNTQTETNEVPLESQTNGQDIWADSIQNLEVLNHTKEMLIEIHFVIAATMPYVFNLNPFSGIEREVEVIWDGVNFSAEESLNKNYLHITGRVSKDCNVIEQFWGHSEEDSFGKINTYDIAIVDIPLSINQYSLSFPYRAQILGEDCQYHVVDLKSYTGDSQNIIEYDWNKGAVIKVQFGVPHGIRLPRD